MNEHRDDSEMSRFDREGVRNYSARDAVGAVGMIVVLLILFAGGSIKDATAQISPGIGRCTRPGIGMYVISPTGQLIVLASIFVSACGPGLSEAASCKMSSAFQSGEYRLAVVSRGRPFQRITNSSYGVRGSPCSLTAANARIDLTTDGFTSSVCCTTEKICGCAGNREQRRRDQASGGTFRNDNFLAARNQSRGNLLSKRQERFHF